MHLLVTTCHVCQLTFAFIIDSPHITLMTLLPKGPLVDRELGTWSIGVPLQTDDLMLDIISSPLREFCLTTFSWAFTLRSLGHLVTHFSDFLSKSEESPLTVRHMALLVLFPLFGHVTHPVDKVPPY